MAHLTLTELRPVGRKLFAGKQIARDGSIIDAPQIKQWFQRQVSFNTPFELFEYVNAAQRQNLITITGLKFDDHSEITLRRKRDKGEPLGFEDHGTTLLIWDIDGHPAPEGWLQNPREAVDAIVRAVFPDTTYVAYLSATPGLIRTPKANGGPRHWTGDVGGTSLRARVLFMTARPIFEDESRAWLTSLKMAAIPSLDPAVATFTQPLYIARPFWHGHPGEDPLGDVEVCWLVEREHQFLDVPDDLQHRARWDRAEGAAGVVTANL